MNHRHDHHDDHAHYDHEPVHEHEHHDREVSPLTLKLREQLRDARGPAYWRSLEELAGDPTFVAMLEDEFPRTASEWPDDLNRRQFLQVMAASLALAGLTGCVQQPHEEIIPYVESPSQIVPGLPLHFATAHLRDGYAQGILVRSNMGRPTKIEGNPQHPSSLGSVDIFSQASVLSLYDPDRSPSVLLRGRPSAWSTFLNQFEPQLQRLREQAGRGLRILTGPTTSPTLLAQLQAIQKRFPESRWHVHAPIDHTVTAQVAAQYTGTPADVIYRMDRADVILALDSDFMHELPGHLRYARDWITRRRVREGVTNLSRLYAVEPMPTITGSNADHRLPLRYAQVETLARWLARRLEISLPNQADTSAQDALYREHQRWLDTMATDLLAARGRSLIIPGLTQPPAVHALAMAINARLQNLGQTLQPIAPIQPFGRSGPGSFAELCDDLRTGQVQTLLIIGCNPVYTAPGDVDFAALLTNVPLRVHHGLYVDETAVNCHWHLPATHELETWSDARAHDGTVTLLQPLIAPLYEGRSAHQVLAVLTGEPESANLRIVQNHWRSQWGEQAFDARWRQSVHDGFVADTASPPVQLREPDLARLPAPPSASDNAIELVLRPDPTIWDGSYANNGWLQELPKQLTKLTWDNALLMSPATAERLGVRSRQVVRVSVGDRPVEAAAWIVPGHANNSVTLHLGYGRQRAGRVGNGAGVDAYRLQTTPSRWSQTQVALQPMQRDHPLACTQDFQAMMGRSIVRAGTIAQFLAQPEFLRDKHDQHPPVSLYGEFKYDQHAWGMIIDLSSCIGCSACVIACVSENNIPVVGRDQVARGRNMHWLRVDRYFEGSPDSPAMHHMPVPCMHCEKAPCEPVCPVGATLHDVEGLNQMIYNRCVGTRYCSNNCPYKVRRFNFLQYAPQNDPLAMLGKNPDVTLRARGVMEKCTYCVQRINAARITASKEHRRIQDGEVITACAQACPTQAIVFGDLNDRNAMVNKLRRNPLNYGLLADLGTQPRTTYLGQIRAPHQSLADMQAPRDTQHHQAPRDPTGSGERASEKDNHT